MKDSLSGSCTRRFLIQDDNGDTIGLFFEDEDAEPKTWWSKKVEMSWETPNFLYWRAERATV